MPRKRTDYGVSAEEFVRAWQAAGSVDEAAEALGMPRGVVLSRASQYRRAGVNLKGMPRAPKNALDVKGLNRIVEGRE